MDKEVIYVGVDIGKSGGIVGISSTGVLLEKHRIPKVKTKVDLPALLKIFTDMNENYSMYVALEDVHSIFGSGAKSNFSFGEIKGIKTGIVVALAVPYLLVQPKTWQKFIWSPSEIIKSGKKTDTKGTSLIAAKRLFPTESFLATERSSVPHDGLVDAALIALYCKNYFR